jgi:hypothetical protein
MQQTQDQYFSLLSQALSGRTKALGIQSTAMIMITLEELIMHPQKDPVKTLQTCFYRQSAFLEEALLLTEHLIDDSYNKESIDKGHTEELVEEDLDHLFPGNVHALRQLG